MRDQFVHLANNAVSSKSTDFSSTGIEGNMWTKDQFVEYLDSLSDKDGLQLWQMIRNKMKGIIVGCFGCVQDMIEVCFFDLLIFEESKAFF